MAPVKISQIIFFSSQDSTFKATNLLNEIGNQKWLSSTTDRSGKIFVELQLDQQYVITNIDIGCHNMFTMEILVNRSCDGAEYFQFLPPSVFIASAQIKQPKSLDQLKMFKTEDFVEDVRDLCWDRLKLICCQPFKKDKQFGINLFRMQTSSMTNVIELNESEDEYNGFKNLFSEKKLNIFTKSSPQFCSSTSNFSRSMQMLNTANNKYSPKSIINQSQLDTTDLYNKNLPKSNINQDQLDATDLYKKNLPDISFSKMNNRQKFSVKLNKSSIQIQKSSSEINLTNTNKTSNKRIKETVSSKENSSFSKDIEKGEKSIDYLQRDIISISSSTPKSSFRTSDVAFKELTEMMKVFITTLEIDKIMRDKTSFSDVKLEFESNLGKNLTKEEKNIFRRLVKSSIQHQLDLGLSNDLVSDKPSDVQSNNSADMIDIIDLVSDNPSNVQTNNSVDRIDINDSNNSLREDDMNHLIKQTSLNVSKERIVAAPDYECKKKRKFSEILDNYVDDKQYFEGADLSVTTHNDDSCKHENKKNKFLKVFDDLSIYFDDF